MATAKTKAPETVQIHVIKQGMLKLLVFVQKLDLIPLAKSGLSFLENRVQHVFN